MASTTLATIYESMESGLTALYGPIKVKFCNFWPHPFLLIAIRMKGEER